MLVLGYVDAMHNNQSVVTLAVAIAVSAVLRPFMAPTLIEQFHLEQRLREQASTDGLTGLLQRNRFLEMARTSLLDTYSKQQTACMLYVDADHFKQINDDYGHAAGDAVLVALAAALRAHSRPTDLIGRMGGEEFALLLPGVSLQHASERAEQLRVAVRDIRRPDGRLTVSIGVAECRRDCCADVDALLARADQAMRQAKRSGRDRAVNAIPATQQVGDPA
jgi:diguanylate cyclase (GGDEF)-like protein